MIEAHPPHMEVMKVMVVNVSSLTLHTRGRHLNIQQMARGRTANHLMVGPTPILDTRHQAGNWNRGEVMRARLDCHEMVESVHLGKAAMVESAMGLQLENMAPWNAKCGIMLCLNKNFSF